MEVRPSREDQPQPKINDLGTISEKADARQSPVPSLEALEKPKPGHTEDSMIARPTCGLKWVLSVASLYSFALLYGLDTTIVADVQPAIINSLGHIQNLAWIGAGFPLGSVATILPLGYAYGLFEQKKLIIACQHYLPNNSILSSLNFTIKIASINAFAAGSAVCGAAPTINVLIVGRVIAGRLGDDT